MSAPTRNVSVTIAASAAVSTPVDLIYQGVSYRVAVIVKPATWTAADLSFELDPDGSGTWYKVVDAAGALVKMTGVSATVAEAHLPPEIADGFSAERIRIVSTNTASEADANQAAARTLIVILVPIA